jgi:hypothetical protein
MASGDWLICLWGFYYNQTYSLSPPGAMATDFTNASSINFFARLIAHLSLSSGGATATETATWPGTMAGDYGATSLILYGTGVPLAPSLSSPANNAVVDAQGSGVTLSWSDNLQGVGPQTQYCLEVIQGSTVDYWTGSTFTTTPTWVSSASTSITVPSGKLTDGLTYTWTAATASVAGQGPYSAPFTLIAEGAPTAPTLVSPANNSYADPQYDPITFTVTHNPTGSALPTGYTFQRHTGSTTDYWNGASFQSGSTVVSVSPSSDTFTITMPAGLWTDGNAYTWTVATVDIGGTSPFAATWTLNAATAPTVVVNSPSGTNQHANPSVSWTVTWPSGQSGVSWRCVVYSATQWNSPGFTPGTSASTWDSGTVGGSAYSCSPVGIPNFGVFYAYVQVTDSQESSLWAYTSWTQAVGIVAVQVGFPLTAGGSVFTLDDPVMGLLDNSTYTLGGTIFVDVTQWCIGQISISRGRSRETDQYSTGTLSFTLRNDSRLFDPTNTASTYYPGIIPRAPVNVYVGGIQVYTGFIDDYNVTYELPSWCYVAVTATDVFAILANAYINNWSASQELTGQRISDLITENISNFPAPLALAPGNTTVQSNIFGANTGGGGQGDVALTDLQNIEASEHGFLFVDRMGNLTFLDRYAILNQLAGNINYATFSDLAADISAGAFGYSAVGMVSATLLLYNEVQGTRNSNANVGGDQPITQIAQDTVSEGTYLIRALSLPTVENINDADVLNLCYWVLGIYHQPEVRFDTVQVVDLQALTIAQLIQLAALEITNLCTVKRTPPGSGTPTTISLPSYIDQINWDFDVSGSTYTLTLAFGSGVNLDYFILDSATYGLLDQNVLGY